MQNLRIRAGILALVGILGLTGCGWDDARQPVSPSAVVGLVGTQWSLATLDGRPVGVGAGAVAPTLILAAEDSRASGFAGCNRFTAGYTLGDEGLRFGPIATTRMFCVDAIELERRYVMALEATRTYRLTGPHLELVGDHGVVARLDMR